MRLHDGPVQSLLAAGQDVRQAIAGRADLLPRVGESIESTTTQLRGAITDLHPPLLRYAGLAAALEDLAEAQARRAGFEATVDVHRDVTGIDDRLVFSVARELLLNVAKHACASAVDVRVALRGDVVELTVRDDGRGFDAEAQEAALRQGHIGLPSLFERVDAIGGSVCVETSRGAGSTVTVCFPRRRERRRAPRTLQPTIGGPTSARSGARTHAILRPIDR